MTEKEATDGIGKAAEIAQDLTFELVDACEVAGCGEGWLCEDHEPLFKGIVALAEVNADLLAALEEIAVVDGLNLDLPAIAQAAILKAKGGAS